MRWYEYKMEVDDLTAPDDLKAKLLAMTDTLTAEEKAEPMMAAPAPQTAAPAAPLNTETKKKKPIHFPVKQLGTLAACLAVCVLGYSTLHLGIGMGSAKSSAPALYAAEGAADSSAASVAAGGFDPGDHGNDDHGQQNQRGQRGGQTQNDVLHAAGKARPAVGQGIRQLLAEGAPDRNGRRVDLDLAQIEIHGRIPDLHIIVAQAALNGLDLIAHVGQALLERDERLHVLALREHIE